VVHALAGIAFLQVAEVEARAEVVTITGDHGSFGRRGQVLENMTQRGDQLVVQRVALGGAGQAHHGNGVLHFKVDVWVGVHGEGLCVAFGFVSACFCFVVELWLCKITK
jgi:hypothetical protein